MNLLCSYVYWSYQQTVIREPSILRHESTLLNPKWVLNPRYTLWSPLPQLIIKMSIMHSCEQWALCEHDQLL